MDCWMLSATISCEAVPYGGRRRAEPRPFITGIAPETGSLYRSGTARVQPHRSGISEDNLASQDMLPDGIGYWFQQGGCLAETFCQCRAVQINTISRENLAHSKKWKMVSITCDQYMSHKVRNHDPDVTSTPRQKRLHKVFAAGAD
jgi:hypothetical protein